MPPRVVSRSYLDASPVGPLDLLEYLNNHYGNYKIRYILGTCLTTTDKNIPEKNYYFRISLVEYSMRHNAFVKSSKFSLNACENAAVPMS